MKPIIFIGSSSNHLSTLQKVESFLADVGECRPWTFAFTMNKSNLDSLMRQTKTADFCILIALKDDLLMKKEEIHDVARDNVMFEFGLFLGSSGLTKAYLLAEDGINLPTDLAGITIGNFSLDNTKHNSLEKVCHTIKDSIKSQQNVSNLGLLPSTALALGYYYNFIQKICEEIHETGKVLVQTKEHTIKEFKFHVIIPKGIDDTGVDTFKSMYYKKMGLSSASTATTNPSKRGYPFVFKLDPPDQDLAEGLTVQLYDVPATLNTILEAIKLHLPTDQVGKNDDADFLEHRELANFAKVLRYLILRNNSTKNNVAVDDNLEI